MEGTKEYSELKKVEQILKNQVDNDFFQDPKSFQPLPRVIDVLGAQLLEEGNHNHNSSMNIFARADIKDNGIPSDQPYADSSNNNNNKNVDPLTKSIITDFDNLHKTNPAYLAMKKQQSTVEEAITHMATHHFSDLNASVVHVGRVSKQFDDAVGKVKGLKRRVMSIRENLATANEAVPGMTHNDASDRNGSNEDDVAEKGKGRVSTTTMIQTGGNSLRELWLKKLECEAVLSLLQKLEIIRETPSAFDALLHPTTITTLSSSQNDTSSTSIVKNTPCRIGAAVVLLSDALTTMFSDDVAQIQALHKIMEQLMTRKQRAEEILWESLQDVLYLRTGNGIDTSMNGENDDLGEEKKDGEDSQQKQQQRPQTSVGESNSHRKYHDGGGGNSSTGGGSGSYKESSSSPNKSSHHRRMRRSSLQSTPKKHRFISVRDGRRGGGMDSDSDSDEEYEDYDDDGSTSRYSGSRSKASSSKQQQQRPYTAPIGKSFDGDNETNGGTTTTTTTSTTSNSTALNPFANFHGHYGRLLPRAMVESEIDLEVDEMRCLESSTFNTNSSHSTYNNSMNGGSYLSSEPDIALPRYTDPILALRILIEALAKLGRLDDVERIIAENVERELRRIGQLEQAKTLSRFERLHPNGPSSSSNSNTHHPKQSSKSSSSRRRRMMDVGDLNQNAAEEKLKIFKSHLRNLLKAFGSVMLRLSHLAQILRHRITSDPKLVTPSYATPSSALHSVLVNAHVAMQKEIKAFLKGCLIEANNTNNPESSTFSKNNRTGKSSLLDSTVSNRGGGGTARSGVSAHEQGIFSLGIITDASLASSIREKYAQNLTSASRSTAMRMTPSEFVTMILCPKTGTIPQIRHALFFRKSLAAWTQECIELKKELASTTREDTSSPEYNATTEETALEFLDDRVKNDLLPMLQDAAVDGTVSVLEKADAFEPITRSDMYTSPLKSQERRVEMNAACNGLFTATGPLFSALQRLPRGGEMYAPLVAHLDHAILTLISRVKQRIQHLCQDKTAFAYLEDPSSKQPTQLSYDVEARRPFSQLWSAYFENDGGMSPPDSSRSLTGGGGGGSIAPLTPSKSDTQSKMPNNNNNNEDEKSNQRSLTADLAGGETDLQREQETFEQEVMHLLEILNFANPDYGKDMLLCTEEEFLKIASLAHSLLTLASLLERRLKPKKVTWGKTTTAPRALRESIKNIRTHGLRVAKFCRIEVLLQSVRRMSLLYKSNSLASKDVVRLPSCVNDFGEYLTSISDVLREYGGNKITAYSLSSLEQYIPLFLMETVRVVAQGTDLPDDFKITLHGVEALHKSCSVLYRDLKTATTFDHSFWDDDVAADAFERAANFIALMELDMEELVSYCRENRNEFTDADYKLMFAMNGPRRKGDRTRYSVLQEHFGE